LRLVVTYVGLTDNGVPWHNAGRCSGLDKCGVSDVARRDVSLTGWLLKLPWGI